MPKLNVQQNNQNVIQAFKNALAIGNLKGIIASDGSHNFSTAGSNRNLLDNPFFTAGNVVNQRGFSSSSAEGYTVDRWKLLRSNIITATLGNDGLTISKSVTGYAFFEQIIGTSIDLEATYTLSVMTSDGQVYSATRKFVNGTSSETYVSIGGMNVGFGLYGKDTTPHAALYFGTSQTGSLTIKAMKLELGSVSTLANDAPPDYETELDHCRKYFYRIKAETSFGTFGNGFCSGGNAAYVLVPINMRKTPTSGSTSGAFRLMVGAGVTTGVTVTYSGNSNSHMARFDVLQSGSSWTAGGSCILSAHSDTNAYIDLNADL